MKDILRAITEVMPKDETGGIIDKALHSDIIDAVQKVKNCSIPLVMPCTSFEHTAVDLKDGSTAVWTDGLSLNSDNDRHCQYKLEGGQKYKVVVYKA